eukprot:TRINITY_DN1224_c0_g1_i1.p1 TRINITY_DN1224_c0_g1~~TRINITY_DN1224_c0_g1_i1.p1  ORF type:complete len:406 (+),score=63.14 TRINITY_DN1224_c0_g1_i1:75-1220(+)
MMLCFRSISFLFAFLPHASSLQMAPMEEDAAISVDASNQTGPFDAIRGWFGSETPVNDQDVHFVSINTQGEIALKTFGFPGEVENVGKGVKWTGYGTKLINVMYYADELPPDDLVVYVDGNDVVWGGCSKKHLLAAYHSIVRASGAKIVVGAEMVCGEQSCDNSTALPKWAQRNTRSLKLERDPVKLTECEEQVKPECRCDMPSQPACRNFKYTGVDDADWNAEQKDAAFLAIERDNVARADLEGSPTFRYLNSGFVMGPAKEIRDMFEWSVFHYLSVKEKKTWMHDQGAIAEYWRQNPSKVALDYQGELSLQLPRLATETLKIDESDSETSSKVVRNRLLGDRVQCFIHNNVNEWNGGPRADYWWKFFHGIRAGSADWSA